MKFAPHIGLSSPMETGNIIENIDRVWDEIALFQIADAPKRTEPNSGEMNCHSQTY